MRSAAAVGDLEDHRGVGAVAVLAVPDSDLAVSAAYLEDYLDPQIPEGLIEWVRSGVLHVAKPGFDRPGVHPYRCYLVAKLVVEGVDRLVLAGHEVRGIDRTSPPELLGGRQLVDRVYRIAALEEGTDSGVVVRGAGV